MDKLFHPTCCNGCNYLSMLGLKLNYVSKRGHRSAMKSYGEIGSSNNNQPQVTGIGKIIFVHSMLSCLNKKQLYELIRHVCPPHRILQQCIFHVQWLFSNDQAQQLIIVNNLITTYSIMTTCISYELCIHYIVAKIYWYSPALNLRNPCTVYIRYYYKDYTGSKWNSINRFWYWAG